MFGWGSMSKNTNNQQLLLHFKDTKGIKRNLFSIRDFYFHLQWRFAFFNVKLQAKSLD